MFHEHPPTWSDPPIAPAPRELDSRASDGIHVQLLWHPVDGHVSVAVNDTKTGDTFVVDVRNGQRAFDVFHHPYAYAVQGGRAADAGTPSAARAA